MPYVKEEAESNAVDYSNVAFKATEKQYAKKRVGGREQDQGMGHRWGRNQSQR